MCIFLDIQQITKLWRCVYVWMSISYNEFRNMSKIPFNIVSS